MRSIATITVAICFWSLSGESSLFESIHQLTFSCRLAINITDKSDCRVSQYLKKLNGRKAMNGIYTVSYKNVTDSGRLTSTYVNRFWSFLAEMLRREYAVK